MVFRRIPGEFLAFLFLAGCAGGPLRQVQAPSPALPAPPISKAAGLVRLAPEALPKFDDDGDAASLRAAVAQSAGYYRSLSPDQVFNLGVDTYSAREMAESMEALEQLLAHNLPKEDWLAEVRKNFIVYQSAGTDEKRTVTFSSYYEPTIRARLDRNRDFRYPLYGRPNDLIDVDLGLFEPSREGARLSGRRVGRSLVPYFTRQDIDSDHVLKDQSLEIAWAKDPLDIFFLQIEGSGWLDVGNGRPVRIRYDGDNGRRYRSLGQYLISTGRVGAKGFGHEKLQKYMRRHPQERQRLLNVNERYIFFHIDTSSTSAYAYGNINFPLTPRRSIATDPKLFPKGGLAWIQVQGPKTSVCRFVLNQDEGGAIQGPGRVDYFAGHGRDAEELATHFWFPGKLYFLVKKKT